MGKETVFLLNSFLLNSFLLNIFLLNSFLLLLCACGPASDPPITPEQEVYQDVTFKQDYGISYLLEEEGLKLEKVVSDRNGVIQVLADQGLLVTRNGQWLYPGTLVPDLSHRPIVDKSISSICTHENQLVYLTQEAILSNAWAGKLFLIHSIEKANLIASGQHFTFLISDGTALLLIDTAGIQWEGQMNADQLIDIKYDKFNDVFWLLGQQSISSFSPIAKKLEKVWGGEQLTAFELTENGTQLIAGTHHGYFTIDTKSKQPIGDLQQKLPATDISSITTIEGQLWFGSTQGAFKLLENGQFNYYSGKRWLPDDEVIDLAAGPNGSVLILTKMGLGIIHFKEMTLQDKAAFFDQQVRSRHIRNGFNASLSGMKNGDVTTGYLSDSDNDGLWTAMYLGGEAFRYAVTKSEAALQNCRESLDAMERLFTINPVPGFPSRSFERSGYIERLADPDRWHHTEDPEWDWKGTTSSDEAIGHIFAYGVLAELVEDEAIKQQAIRLIDMLMQHILDHDLYMVDYDGKPTTWAKWNPTYVNARPKMVGDRKLNSSNIMAMLQTAYHFTQKEVYKEKAFELINEHGYLDNLMYPMDQVKPAPADADDWSKMLSEEWNHSDDEMYFLGYWGLYRYAFNDSLKVMYKQAIIDHWEIERPEKEGLWNIFTAITGTEHFDIEEAAWYLREYPLDLRTWDTRNSHRKDIEKIAPNFRGQTTTEVLPPDETRIARHNANRFTLDSGGAGNSEYSAGDIWLLPYWMGRYLGVISAAE
ncbi:MAG: hypothetical protein R2828_26280 [Saprospiraceae bacterium]